MSTNAVEAEVKEVSEVKEAKVRRRKDNSIFNGPIMRRALLDALKKLDPRWQLKTSGGAFPSPSGRG